MKLSSIAVLVLLPVVIPNARVAAQESAGWTRDSSRSEMDESRTYLMYTESTRAPGGLALACTSEHRKPWVMLMTPKVPSASFVGGEWTVAVRERLDSLPATRATWYTTRQSTTMSPTRIPAGDPRRIERYTAASRLLIETALYDGERVLMEFDLTGLSGELAWLVDQCSSPR